jgi:hypothetical membrane protein
MGWNAQVASRRRFRLITISAFSGILGPIVFTIVIVILGFQWHGYNHLTQAISELGATNAPNMNLQAANFVVLGILTILFATGLWLHNRSFRTSGILVAIYGVAAIVAGPVHCDPGCPVVTSSTIQILHNVDALIAFVAFAFAPLFFWQSAKTIPKWNKTAQWSLNFANVSIPLVATYLAIATLSLSPYTGLLQRVFLGFLFAWLIMMSVSLFRENQAI